AWRTDAAADAPRPRVLDGRRRLGLRAAQGDGNRPGIRLLRRRDAAGVARHEHRSGAARRRRVGSDCRAVARIRRHHARVSLPPSLRAAQAVRAAGTFCGIRALRRRDRVRRRNRRTPDQVLEVASAVRPVDDRPAVGSRRRARRPRRAGARALRLRRSDPRAVDYQAGKQRGRRPARQALRGALDGLIAGRPIQSPSDVPADARERLQALGYVGAQTDVSSAPGETLPDPKDKRDILETYRAAVDRAGDRKWRDAIALLQQILRDDPGMADVWSQLAAFAVRVERYDLATDAYKHFIELKPSDPGGYLGAAATLFKQQKLKEAREHADFAAQMAAERDSRSRVIAHELLAKIALARH